MAIRVQRNIPLCLSEGVEKQEIEVKIAKLISLCAASAIVMAAFGVLAAGDIAKGKKLAKKCKTCHTLNEGGKNRLGPNLFDILDKPAGAVKGYKYSKAMKESGIKWDDATFTDFVTKPKRVVKGTKMSFAGLKKPKDRANLIIYLRSLSDQPKPLP